jgi:hypothetical protein
MYNVYDVQLARERYQEWVRAAEMAAEYRRDESGAIPPSPRLKEQWATWKAYLQRSMHFLVGKRGALQQTR